MGFSRSGGEVAEALAEKIEPREIEEELKNSYIDYAMSVIVGRALPDARDGLKPVHRRILYAMYDMGMLPGRPYKKCARIVGECLGKYHPHGDVAVYDTLVRMAQDFSHRYELIDGYGNFGSVDGDPPAAMRYTEARLSKLSMELLRDIEKETVDFTPNFDETLQEPTVLPARFPNLLVNGSAGIAVGMATNIPPHNLGEVIEAAILLIDKPEAETKDFLKVLKGPDFPTGGIIMGRRGLKAAYEKGRGIIKLRGKAQVEEAKGRNRLVVKEIPFQVNKARLSQKIAALVKEKKLSEITELRDESDREGLRLVLELKREAIPQIVLNKLYKHTQLEITFGAIMLALVDGVPRLLPLKGLLESYLNHQKEVVKRRTQFDLKKSEEKAHLLAGLAIALKNLDEVIKIIRRSKTPQEAQKKLMESFKLSPKQAQAVLEMRLQRLTRLEREKIEAEHKELLKKIAELKEILLSEKRILKIIKAELQGVKEKHSDPRRTQITRESSELVAEDLIPHEEMVITLTHWDYIKRLPLTTYRRQLRGGKGVLGMDLKEEDFVEHLFVGSTHHLLLLFTNQGRVYRLKVYEVPLKSRTARGEVLANLLPLRTEEKITAVVSVPDFEQDLYLTMATKKGLVKKTPLKKYDTTRREGIAAINLKKGDELVGVKLTSGEENIILVSKGGRAIKFSEKDARPMGRASSGVKGIKLAPDDEVLGMEIALEGAELFVITEKGHGKRTALSSYPSQSRGGKGVKTLKILEKRGKLAGAKVVKIDQELMFISQEGILMRTPVRGVPRQSRSTQGVRVMSLKGEDKVSALAWVIRSES